MTPTRTPVSILPVLIAGMLAGAIACDKSPVAPSEQQQKACTTLPAEVLRRQYTARIYEPKTLWVELVGADMEAWGWAGFTGTRDGSSVHFDIDDSYSIVDDDWVFVERLDPQRNLAFSGVATGTIEEDAIIATFDGRVQLRSVSGFPPTVFAECKAADQSAGVRESPTCAPALSS